VNAKVRVVLGSLSLLALSAALVGTSWGDSLSDAQQQLAKAQEQAQQLKNQSQKTSQKIQEQKQETAQLQQSLQQTQSSLAVTQQQIDTNQAQQQQLQDKIDALNSKIQTTQAELQKDTNDVNQMLRASYEYGTVPYMDVIFQSTSFSDLLTRLNLISAVTKSEQTMVQNVSDLQTQLKQQRSDENSSIHELQLKATELSQMKSQEVSLKSQKQQSIETVSRSINALQQEEDQYSQQMHLTQQQISDLKQQIAEAEAIAATQSGNVVESDLRYQTVSAQKLYDYVQNYDSTYFKTPSAFSVSDMQTICNAAQSYNVNPILLVAITGQEESFVPKAWSAWPAIHKNPFNVYYSWMWTNEYRPQWNLTDTAGIAANTVRHKLSTPPPSGEDPFVWINDPKNPWGLYATDRNWSAGVEKFFKSITSYVNS